ncbi:hypothetical protein BDD12DRAFT_351709 [Trichophaea hybrida]|nr:hypothetical protein BDD12DRAFT_351709 [Trichophaea hybrida]
MIPFFLLTFSLLTFSLLPLSATAETFPVVRRAYPPLQRRLDFIGAAPLRSQGCPSDLQDCGNDSMNWCCPKTTKCVSSFCCPTENRCDELVKTTPSCANPEYGLFTWTNKLWGVQYFCCKKGELGYLTTSGNRGSEACGKPPLGVASSLMATACVRHRQSRLRIRHENRHRWCRKTYDENHDRCPRRDHHSHYRCKRRRKHHYLDDSGFGHREYKYRRCAHFFLLGGYKEIYGNWNDCWDSCGGDWVGVVGSCGMVGDKTW